MGSIRGLEDVSNINNRGLHVCSPVDFMRGLEDVSNISNRKLEMNEALQTPCMDWKMLVIFSNRGGEMNEALRTPCMDWRLVAIL